MEIVLKRLETMVKGFIGSVGKEQQIMIEKEVTFTSDFFETSYRKDEWDNRIPYEHYGTSTITKEQLVVATAQDIETIDTVEILDGEKELKPKVLRGQTGIKKMMLGRDIKKIAGNAVVSTGVEEVNFGPELRYIAEYAFAKNKNLRRVEFIGNSTNIEMSPFAFFECGNFDVFLNGKKLNKNHPLFQKCKTTHLVVNSVTLSSQLVNMSDLESVEVVNPNCMGVGMPFMNCPNLKTVKIGDQTFDVEQVFGYSLIRTSDIKNVRGVSMAKYKKICGSEVIVTWRDKDFVFTDAHRGEKSAFSQFMGKMLSAKRAELFGDIVNKQPWDTISLEPISVQEINCFEAACKMWDVKCVTDYRAYFRDQPLYLDCDECEKRYSKIYQSCMNRAGLSPEKSR